MICYAAVPVADATRPSAGGMPPQMTATLNESPDARSALTVVVTDTEPAASAVVDSVTGYMKAGVPSATPWVQTTTRSPGRQPAPVTEIVPPGGGLVGLKCTVGVLDSPPPPGSRISSHGSTIPLPLLSTPGRYSGS